MNVFSFYDILFRSEKMVHKLLILCFVLHRTKVFLICYDIRRSSYIEIVCFFNQLRILLRQYYIFLPILAISHLSKPLKSYETFGFAKVIHFK
jgi:hypothetical protein